MRPFRLTHSTAVLGLLGTAFIWGGTFAAVAFSLRHGLSVGALLSLRFGIGSLALAALMLILRVRPRLPELKDGLWLGVVLSAIFWLQTDGLRFTTTSKSGFITGLYVIFTPMAAMIVGDRLRPSHAVGALMALAGLLMLVYEPGLGLTAWNRGDTETLGNALLVGVHIVMTGRFSRRSNGWVLAWTQVTVVAVLALLGALLAPAPYGFQGAGALLRHPGVWIALGYLGLLGTTLALWLQSTLQSRVSATETAILFSLEPVFAALLAVSGFVPGIRESLGGLQILGAALIFGATLVAELGPRLLGMRAAEALD
ncbi:MAG TPA: DMT family transporter [Holophagaceae bacterium]|nr:DMT family transporter [Holophagaceae bacterium]